MDYHIIAQHSDFRAATHQPLQDHATGDGADFRYLVDFAHLDHTKLALLLLRR